MRNRKRLKRTCLIVAILIIMTAVLYGCGEGKADLPDTAALASALIERQPFSEELQPVDSEIALVSYGLDKDDIAQCTVYKGTGATAEEAAVFQAANEDYASRVRTALEAYVEAQKKSFGNYIPKEVPKLEQAVIARRDNTIVLCVPADSGEGARALCEEYGLQ